VWGRRHEGMKDIARASTIDGGVLSAHARRTSMDAGLALDAESLDANRHGRLSMVQRKLVRREMVQRAMNAWAIAAVGFLLPLAIPSVPARILAWSLVTLVVLYVASRGYDCARDSFDGRVAEITDRYVLHPKQKSSADGTRVLVSVGLLKFWVRTEVEAEFPSPTLTVYFTPRSRLVLNAESA